MSPPILTKEIEAAAIKAAAYLRELVDEHGGEMTLRADPMGYDRVTLTVKLEHHPAPPGRMGWSGAAEPDPLSQAILQIDLATLISRDLAARLGDPSNPDNCTCYECYEKRLNRW